jgi:hypothetical protein
MYFRQRTEAPPPGIVQQVKRTRGQDPEKPYRQGGKQDKEENTGSGNKPGVPEDAETIITYPGAYHSAEQGNVYAAGYHFRWANASLAAA